MTTICWRDGILACDSRMTAGDTIMSDQCDKIIEITDGAGNPMLIAGSGHLDDIAAFAFWVKGGCVVKEKPDLDQDSFAALFVNHDGLCFKHMGKHKFGLPIRQGEYTAIGTGRDFALAAMDSGRNAVEAVNVAIGRDPFSGGEVRAAQMSGGQIQRSPKFTSYPRMLEPIEQVLKNALPEERERIIAAHKYAKDITKAREIQKTFESGELNVASTLQEPEQSIRESQGQEASDQDVRCDADTATVERSVEHGELPTAGSILRPRSLEQKSLGYWNERRLDAIQALYPEPTQAIQPADSEDTDRSDPAV